jgi:ABC-type Zn uptake system ZnuABC Zn-binding protein ZnuA
MTQEEREYSFHQMRKLEKKMNKNMIQMEYMENKMEKKWMQRWKN